MENTIVKTLIYNKQVRLFFTDNTKLISEILELNHQTNKTLKRILGKTISIVSLLSGTLKEEQRISLQLTLSNPNYKVFADTDAKGNIRGYLNKGLLEMPHDYIENISLDHLIGHKGIIRVIKGAKMNQFTGITDMPYQNIDGDISHYFIKSEQTPTYIRTHIEFDNENRVLFSHAIYAQLLPGAAPELLNEIEKVVSANPDFLIDLKKYNQNNVEVKLKELFKQTKMIGYSPIQFYCGCSKEMFYGMLHSLGENELKQAMNKKESIDTTCQVCGRTYHFSSHDIDQLLQTE
ncbi:Hsp33 family molecular chaperone HslO [Amphibacillus sp. Q70]|uniref:Hsp33 family molecular chaperone HslO n=1 Tax=Amphibacillus sp. Q70 TaxID=3453416 RepID=UPI003F82CA49